jgi:hypothetical protein
VSSHRHVALAALLGWVVACPTTAPGGGDDDLVLGDDDVADDDSAGDDDVVDDDSAPDDDTAGDDDATPDEDGCGPSLSVGLGSLPGAGGAGSALRWSLSLDRAHLQEGVGAVFHLEVTNTGSSTVSADWDNCGAPVFAVAGQADVVLWSGSEADDVDCKGPSVLSLAPGASQAWTMTAEAVGGGPLVARATSSLAVHGPDGTSASGPTGAVPWPFVEETAFFVSEASWCPVPEARASFLAGFGLHVTVEAPTIPAGLGLTVSGAGEVGAQDVPGPWDNCGLPEFAVHDPDGLEVWRWSDAWEMDCAPRSQLDGLSVVAWDEFVPTEVIDRAGPWTVETTYRRLLAPAEEEVYAVRTVILATD